jgi:hypothetical protein
MPDITVNEATAPSESLKNQPRTREARKSFFAIALNIGFFLCYFRRRVDFVGVDARSRKHKQEI